jgi:acyl dehydratase
MAIETAYVVTRAAIVDYARAIGETHPWCLDPAAARAGGHRDVVAPPMFAAVYAMPAVQRLQREETVAGVDMTRLLHAGQRFRWPPGTRVVAGDEITTGIAVTGVEERDSGVRFVRYRTRSVNGDGVVVCIGDWTAAARA